MGFAWLGSAAVEFDDDLDVDVGRQFFLGGLADDLAVELFGKGDEPGGGRTTLAFLDGAIAENDTTKPFYTRVCSDPPSTLFVMDDPALTKLTAAQTAAFLTAFFQRYHHPRPEAAHASSRLVTYSAPIRLLAWRLDRPARMILYTATAPPPPSELDPLAPMQPHTFAKTVLEERTRRPAPSVIQQLPSALTPASNSDAIRTSLAHYARTVLTPYYERVTTAIQPYDHTKRRWIQATSHTLEEAMACFIHPPREHHTEVFLNGSRQWDKGHIDPRYDPRTHQRPSAYPPQCSSPM